MITLKKFKNVFIKGKKYKYRITGAKIMKSDLLNCVGSYYDSSCYDVWFQNKKDAQRLYLKYVNTEKI